MKRITTILLSLGMPVVALAQDQPPLPGVPAKPAAAPDLQGQRIYIRKGQPWSELNMDEYQVAELYRELTGKRVIYGSAVTGIEIAMAPQRGPLTYDEALELFLATIEMEGFTFVPLNDRVVKFVRRDTAFQEGVTYISTPEELPEGDQFVTYRMSMNYLKPDDAMAMFNSMVGQLSPGGKIVAAPNAAALIVTEKTSLIRYLLKLKEDIDVPPQTVATKWVDVRYGDADSLAQVLNEILNAQQQSGKRGGAATRRAPAQNTPPGVPNAAATSGGAATAAEDVPMQIVAEPRNNRLFLMGRPMDLVFAEGLIKEFDARPSQRNYMVRKLSFLSVSEFLNVAENLLTQQLGEQDSAGGSRSTANNQNSRRNNNQNSRNPRGSSGGSSSAGSVLSSPEINTAPQSMLVGKTLLIADNVSNSLIVKGPPEAMRVVGEMLDRLDGRPKQVMISTVFGQLSLNENREVGVDLFRTLDESGDYLGAGQTRTGGPNGLPGTNFLDIDSLTDAANFNNVAGLSLYGRIGNHFGAYLRALHGSGDFTVLSRPTVYTTNNNKAVISSGQRIAVPTTSTTSGSGFSNTNIEFRDVVLSLEVVPLINSDDEVTLEIALLNDEVVGTQVIDGNEIPMIGTRELITKVTVPNRSTVVLGGLISESNRETVSGVPVLSSIPVVKHLFSTTSNEKVRQELLIFIQPQIVGGESELQDAQDDLTGRFDVTPASNEMAEGASPTVLPQLEQEKVVPVRRPRPDTKNPKAEPEKSNKRKFVGPRGRRR